VIDMVFTLSACCA